MLTAEERETIRRMNAEGYSCREIGEATHREKATIQGHLKNMGLHGAGKGGRPKLSEIKRQKRIRCWQDGLTDKESAERCGITQGTYSQWRIGEGLKRNGRRR